jgi:hypothetical protein
MDAWGWVPEDDGEHIYLPKTVNAHDIRVVISALEDLHLVWDQAKVRPNKPGHTKTQGTVYLVRINIDNSMSCPRRHPNS